MTRPTLSVLLGAFLIGSPQAFAQSADPDAWCKERCATQAGQCLFYCLRLPVSARVIYTADMVPLGTPVQVRVHPIHTNLEVLPPLEIVAEDDLVINGKLILVKGAPGYAHFTTGNAGWNFTPCEPFAGIQMNTAPLTAAGMSMPAGFLMPNYSQFLPLSFANPNVPESSSVVQIPLSKCGKDAATTLTAYVSGPPSEFMRR